MGMSTDGKRLHINREGELIGNRISLFPGRNTDAIQGPKGRG